MNDLARHEHNKQLIRNWNDAPVSVDVKQSIVELRRIYSNLTQTEFVNFYSRRYRIARSIIDRVLAEEDWRTGNVE